MRFAPKNVQRILEAVEAMQREQPDPHRHTRDWAEEVFMNDVPRLVDAYCAATGLELPVS